MEPFHCFVFRIINFSTSYLLLLAELMIKDNQTYRVTTTSQHHHTNISTYTAQTLQSTCKQSINAQQPCEETRQQHMY